jgi:hypothetical protein
MALHDTTYNTQQQHSTVTALCCIQKSFPKQCHLSFEGMQQAARTHFKQNADLELIAPDTRQGSIC